mmetsp:Transcript_86401/g.270339  ORF Transcript_86401/g.270339 Transcript_86401/m.270339 type:complete len:282 (+) Transcript_86401:183-1028(+)
MCLRSTSGLARAQYIMIPCRSLFCGGSRKNRGNWSSLMLLAPGSKAAVTFRPFLSLTIKDFSYLSLGLFRSVERSPVFFSRSFFQELLQLMEKQLFALLPAWKSMSTRLVNTTSSERGSEASAERSAGKERKTAARSSSLASESAWRVTPPCGASFPKAPAWFGTTGKTFFLLVCAHFRSNGEQLAARSSDRSRIPADHSCRNSTGGLVSRNSVQAIQRIRAPSRWPSSQKTSTHLLKVGQLMSSKVGLVVILPTQFLKTTVLSSVAEVLHVTAEPNLSTR